MSRTILRPQISCFRSLSTFSNKRLLMAWAEEAKEAGALQASSKAIAKARALPCAYDDLPIANTLNAWQFAKETLSSSYYAKFKLLAKNFYICYGKSLYKLSYDTLFQSNKLKWHMLAEEFVISSLLMLSIKDAMVAINESYAYNCLVLAERFKSWNKSCTLSESMKLHCKDL